MLITRDGRWWSLDHRSEARSERARKCCCGMARSAAVGLREWSGEGDARSGSERTEARVLSAREKRPPRSETSWGESDSADEWRESDAQRDECCSLTPLTLPAAERRPLPLPARSTADERSDCCWRRASNLASASACAFACSRCCASIVRLAAMLMQRWRVEMICATCRYVRQPIVQRHRRDIAVSCTVCCMRFGADE